MTPKTLDDLLAEYPDNSDFIGHSETRVRKIIREAHAIGRAEGAESAEPKVLQLIDEQDAAEEALSQAYFFVIGRSPEWSNLFGHKQALEEIGDAIYLLKRAAKP